MNWKDQINKNLYTRIENIMKEVQDLIDSDAENNSDIVPILEEIMEKLKRI